MLERDFQRKLIKEIKSMFPGCIVQKNDTIQGFPDITIYYGPKWATLECKKSKNEVHQPNQDYYVDLTNKMSFSRFIYPENKEEVLRDLQQTFES